MVTFKNKPAYKILIFVFTYLILLGIFVGSLTLTAFIPQEKLWSNIAQGAKVIEEETIYPTMHFFTYYLQFDNFSESIILNQTLNTNPQAPYANAVSSIQYQIDDPLHKYNPVENLTATIHQNKPLKEFAYTNYWHGYRAYLRPLLLFFNYSQVRIILLFITTILLCLFVYRGEKVLGLKNTLFILLGFFFAGFPLITYQVQFTSAFLVLLIALLVYLKHPQWQGTKFHLFLFIVGAVHSFVDLFAAPLITLGVLLIVRIIILQKNNSHLKWHDYLQEIIVDSIFWGLGYGLLWASKWILGEQLLPGTISQSLHRILYRTSNAIDSFFSPFQALLRNARYLFVSHKLITLIIAVLTIYYLIRNIFYQPHHWRQKLLTAFPYLIIAFMPYVWYLIVANHSYIHFWITYRVQMISVIAGLIALSQYKS